MDRIKTNQLSWLKKTTVRWGILSGVWVVFVVLVVVPTWQGVMDRHAEIDDLETRLATMDDWTVAGMWLAPSVKERTLPVNAAFSRLFPAERRREELFLSLARVADESRVNDFTLSEARDSGMENTDVWNDGAALVPENVGEPPMAGGEPPMVGGEPSVDGGVKMEIPKVELSSYRVKTQFYGDYQRVAHFMNGLKSIERALKIHSLVILPQREGIQVKLELDVYVSKTSQS